MWTCPKCGEKVEDSFEVCWSCGTTPGGVEDPSFVTADEAAPIPNTRWLDKPVADPDAELPEPPLELVEAYRPRDAAEAKFLADRLAEQGIPAVVQGTYMSVMEIPVSLFAPRLMVREQDLPDARAFCRDYEFRKRERARSDEDEG
jgi:hypothetical protein